MEETWDDSSGGTGGRGCLFSPVIFLHTVKVLLFQNF